MKRTLIAVAALLGLASAANAASVTVVADQATYNPGDTITITVTGTANLGEASTQVLGTLLTTGTGSLGGGVANQAPLNSFGVLNWTLGVTNCNATVCTAFNQLFGTGAAPVGNTPLAISVVTYTAGGAGIVNLNWDASTFDFFGAPLGQGVSFEIVPEPTTAALLGLGLLGLAVSGRRRA